jgi:hypothetical protein
MNRIVVLIPKRNASDRILRSTLRHEGASCSGRTWLYPDGRTVTYATPDQAPMSQPYVLRLEGWGHKLTPRESVQVAMWRENAG